MVLKNDTNFRSYFMKNGTLLQKKKFLLRTYMFCFVKFVGMICYCDTKNMANFEVFWLLSEQFIESKPPFYEECTAVDNFFAY